MLYDTLDEYTTAITEARAAIKRQMLIGAETSNDSGGSSRAMTEVEFSSLQSYLALLQKEKRLLDPNERSAFVVRAGW